MGVAHSSSQYSHHPSFVLPVNLVAGGNWGKKDERGA